MGDANLAYESLPEEGMFPAGRERFGDPPPAAIPQGEFLNRLDADLLRDTRMNTIGLEKADSLRATQTVNTLMSRPLIVNAKTGARSSKA